MDIQLRHWKFSDATELARLANNRKIWDNVRDRFPHPYTVKKADEWISAVLSQKPICNFAITVDGRLAGGIGIVVQEDVSRCSAEVGYWVGEPYWGQNVATLALMRLIPVIWKDHPVLTRLFAQVFVHNKASARVLEKCGFYLECTRKRSAIKNDVVCDEFVYALLKP